ncbi:MAG: tetratricopeptide repeat protein [Betaproteobacteria bacterium]|nr:tetratricopeptide repeat protein [Betaproteobacteria bacterium]
MSRLNRAVSCVVALACLTGTPAFANMGESGASSTEANFVAGRQAIEKQDWEGALNALRKAVAADPGNADAHNWLGFAYRKLGKFAESFSAYDEALRINPQHKAAHEYIGEAYLQTDQLDKAETHLAELNRLCTPIPCEEYKDLKRAINEYKKSHR